MHDCHLSYYITKLEQKKHCFTHDFFDLEFFAWKKHITLLVREKNGVICVKLSNLFYVSLIGNLNFKPGFKSSQESLQVQLSCGLALESAQLLSLGKFSQNGLTKLEN